LHPLLFQTAKETLHDRVIPAIADAAHAALNPLRREQFSERFAGLLRPAIRVMD
jgi:hypothetical protein